MPDPSRWLLVLALAVGTATVRAQPPAGQGETPARSAPAPAEKPAAKPADKDAPTGAAAPATNDNAPAAAAPQPQSAAANKPPTSDDICRALEQDAAENGLPVEFFARVIWQESRFNARAVSPKGAQGIAQFMPQTADLRGLADPFDPIEALKHSASYLHDLKN